MRAFWQSRVGRVIRVVSLALVGLFAWTLWTRRHAPPKGQRIEETTAGTPTKSNAASSLGAVGVAQGARERFSTAVGALKSAAKPESSRKVLAELRNVLSHMARAEASAVIRDILDSGTDAPSRLGFSIGPDGFLKEPPTLRVFLLDHLARVDPSAAASYAEKVLSSFSSPDEWAISLRNYAIGKTDAETRTFLQQKFRQMIRYEPWEHNPSVGFLEAFDVAVHAGGTELIPDLTELLREKNNKAVAHAAYLALDRLTIQEPTAVLGRLMNEPDLMQGREQTRANFFARADMSDPQQAAILQNYLLNDRLTAGELNLFADLFPNANYMVSHNLLTAAITPDRNALVRRDQYALQAVQRWISDPRFARIEPQLEGIRHRLETFVNQAGGQRGFESLPP